MSWLSLYGIIVLFIIIAFIYLLKIATLNEEKEEQVITNKRIIKLFYFMALFVLAAIIFLWHTWYGIYGLKFLCHM